MTVKFTDTFDGHTVDELVDASLYTERSPTVPGAPVFRYSGDGDIRLYKPAASYERGMLVLNQPPLVDQELNLGIRVTKAPSSTHADFFRFWLRANGQLHTSSSTSLQPDTGVSLQWVEPAGTPGGTGNRLMLQSLTNSSGPSLGTVWAGLPTIVTGGLYRVRARIVGRRIQVRIWNAANPEPSTWLVDMLVPDATALPVAAGAPAFGAYNGASQSAEFAFTDVTLDDTLPDPITPGSPSTTKLKLWHNNAWRTTKLAKAGTWVDRGVLRNGDGTVYTG